MRATLRYALLFAIPAGVAMGSGIWLMTQETGLGLAIGLAVGALVFVIVSLGGATGSPDEELAGGPRGES